MAEASGADGKATVEAAKLMEEAVEAVTEGKATEKLEQAREKAKEATKGKTPKGKKAFWYSTTGSIQALLRKTTGYNVPRPLIRAAMSATGYGGYTTLSGVARAAVRGFKKHQLSSAIKNKDYEEIERLHKKHFRSGKGETAWRTKLKKAS